jgi:hypothetical protein
MSVASGVRGGGCGLYPPVLLRNSFSFLFVFDEGFGFLVGKDCWEEGWTFALPSFAIVG